MGSTRTPTYRYEAEYRDIAGRTRTMTGAWDRAYGRPTAANAERWAGAFARSTRIGGCNEAMGRAEGMEVLPYVVRIVRQSTRETVAEWRMPMFYVVA